MNDLFCDFDHIGIFKNPMPILRLWAGHGFIPDIRKN